MLIVTNLLNPTPHPLPPNLRFGFPTIIVTAIRENSNIQLYGLEQV
jgi:hypothetical protein